jgi:hemerythrin-like domain-containing protein
MDIYKLLKQDHDAVKAIFKDLEATSEQASQKRETLFAELNTELTLHALAEEKLLYPLLKDAEESRELTLEAVEEHKVVKKLLKELEAGDKASEQWLAKLKVLKENVEHHVEEEEGELFKKAKKVISSEEAELLGDEVEDFKEEQTHLFQA